MRRSPHERQDCITEISESHLRRGEKHHTLNEYLYSDLEAPYPGLYYLTAMLSRIKEFPDRPETDRRHTNHKHPPEKATK
jgi:hypothetical protein